jgi:hypothetical protein
MDREEVNTEDRVAIPEARIVKYQYLFDYYDAKEAIINYVRTGKKSYLLKANNSLIGLYLQIKQEFTKIELKSNKFKSIDKIEYFLENRNKMPSYRMILVFFNVLQTKLKQMKILDITFPEADIGKDFQRSW